MSIWFKDYLPEELNAQNKQTLMEHLDIIITEVGSDYLKATMPVDSRTVQPMRLLHGGASLALAESLGSIAAAMTLDPKKQFCVGLEINGNHIRSVKNGVVTGITRAVHIGKKTQVWEIKIVNQENKLVCISRITLAVLNIPKKAV